jgi:hypothetical protein
VPGVWHLARTSTPGPLSFFGAFSLEAGISYRGFLDLDGSIIWKSRAAVLLSQIYYIAIENLVVAARHMRQGVQDRYGSTSLLRLELSL